MPMLITDPRQPDNPIVFANAAFARLTLYSRDEIIGRNCRFLQGPDTNRGEVARLRAAIEMRSPIELELLNYRKDGSTFWNRLLVSPVFGDDGALTYYFASQFDVTEEREHVDRLRRDRDTLETELVRRTAELQASEQRLRFALEAGRLGSWSIDLQTGRLTTSAECKAICGRRPDDSLTLDELRASIHPEDLALQIQSIEDAIANHSLLDVEYRIHTPAGEERWVQIRGHASYRADGVPLFITGTTQDVTDRRRAQGQRALLAREQSHRIKNMLASLQAIVAQTIRRATSLDEAGATLAARIQAMSAANDLLISEDFGDASIADLVRRTLAPFGIEDTQRFRIHGPDLRLEPQQILAYALALHELATNATKYGALSNQEGTVEVSWRIIDDGANSTLRLNWQERNGPTVQRPARTSFGTQLIQRVLSQEISGTVEIAYEADGVIFVATSPIAATQAELQPA